MEATRPLQYVCLFQAEIPTKEDGDIYTYLAVDVFTDFVFITGFEKDRSPRNILNHTRFLLQHPDFKAALQELGQFTLVYHKFAQIADQIKAIIEPAGGSLRIDDAMVTRVVTPVLKHLFEYLANKPA
jgi:hypothetical protein